MKYHYQTRGVCPSAIELEIKENKVYNVKFLGGGCPGNLQAVPKLVEGMNISELQQKLEGIHCGRKDTSCADQLVQAVKEAISKEQQPIS